MDNMYAIIQNKQLKEASPGITRELAIIALSMAKAGKLPNASFKKDRDTYLVKAPKDAWKKAQWRLDRFSENFNGTWIF